MGQAERVEAVYILVPHYAKLFNLLIIREDVDPMEFYFIAVELPDHAIQLNDAFILCRELSISIFDAQKVQLIYTYDHRNLIFIIVLEVRGGTTSVVLLLGVA